LSLFSFSAILLKEESMKNGEREPKFNHRTGNLEKRRHSRLGIDLPIEYTRRDLVVKQDRATNASEGGLLADFSEPMEVGQYLRIKLFFPSCSVLNVIEMVTQVVWMDVRPRKDRGDYRAGVRCVTISKDDLSNLKKFLGSLSE
jgi:hypothetical protein